MNTEDAGFDASEFFLHAQVFQVKLRHRSSERFTMPVRKCSMSLADIANNVKLL